MILYNYSILFYNTNDFNKKNKIVIFLIKYKPFNSSLRYKKLVKKFNFNTIKIKLLQKKYKNKSGRNKKGIKILRTKKKNIYNINIIKLIKQKINSTNIVLSLIFNFYSTKYFILNKNYFGFFFI